MYVELSRAFLKTTLSQSGVFKISITFDLYKIEPSKKKQNDQIFLLILKLRSSNFF